jgi:hypothetical protein
MGELAIPQFGSKADADQQTHVVFIPGALL